MLAVHSLAEMEPWCQQARVGDEESFVVSDEITQDTASAFAFGVNKKRVGHVWVEVKGFSRSPDPETRIDVRCTH
jgi:hypothetical protein